MRPVDVTTPRISVVIPCFNAAAYLASALQSVAAQDWPDLEVIVVDDGSTDDSVVSMRRDFPTIKLITQTNAGVAAARNAGVAQATGDWIAFLDADDIWLAGKLRAQADCLSANPQADMAYSAWQVWQSGTPQPQNAANWHALAKDEARWAGPSGWIYPQLLLDCEVWTSTVIMRRTLFDDLDGFDARLRIGEDYDLWLRASRVTPILRVPRPLALYRSHPASITRGVPALNYRGQVVAGALERWGYVSPDGRSARPADVSLALARSWVDFGSSHLSTGDVATAWSGALRALSLAPSHPPGWKLLAKAAASRLFS